ncbi:hypothetical protein [Bradyrhizobium sp. ORS 86]|uniref:hypothetical protein n=1 Tax=Bradyrhizobium sp. ORS 86 TaxID=1685970 RepID=UPI00388F35AC
MLAEDDLLAMVTEARAELDRSRALAEAAKAKAAHAEGMLAMAEHVLNEFRVSQQRAADAAEQRDADRLGGKLASEPTIEVACANHPD